MSISKALQAYQSLTPDQKIFVKEKRIEGAYTPEQWLIFFSKIAEYDALRDASSGKFAWLGCGCVTFVIASFIIGFIVIFLLPVAFLVLILAIIIGIYLSRQRTDIPNHLRQFIVPLLSVLNEEMRRGETMFLRVDLSSPTAKEKLFSEQLSAGGLRLQKAGSKITEKFFSNQWLVGTAELADGTKLQWQIFDRVRQRVEGKKRTSGKFKTKTKLKIKSRVQVEMQFKRKDYLLKPFQLNTPTEKIEVKAGVNRDKISVRRIFVSNQENKVTPLSELLDAIATAYKKATPNQQGGQP
jgi:hypothetical protein